MAGRTSLIFDSSSLKRVMKRFQFIFVALLIAVTGAGALNDAAARPGHHHGRSRTHVGVYVGPAIGWSWQYYPAPYAYAPYTYPPYGYAPYPPSYYPHYPPAIVLEPAGPSSYIEQAPPGQQQAQPAPNDWFYCKKPEGYYPHVKRCPRGWERVPAQPPE